MYTKTREAFEEWRKKRKQEEAERRAHKCCRNCGFYADGDCGYWDYPEKDIDNQHCRKWR